MSTLQTWGGSMWGGVSVMGYSTLCRVRDRNFIQIRRESSTHPAEALDRLRFHDEQRHQKEDVEDLGGGRVKDELVLQTQA